jgi:hypothetical protein
VKKAEAFAAQVEFLAGKTVNKIDPTAKPAPPAIQQAPEAAPVDEATTAESPAAVEEAKPAEAPAAPKGGRIAKTLAEEIYSEVVEAEKKGIAPAFSAPVETPAIPDVEAVKPEPPQPVVRNRSSRRPRRKRRSRPRACSTIRIQGFRNLSADRSAARTRRWCCWG